MVKAELPKQALPPTSFTIQLHIHSPIRVHLHLPLTSYGFFVSFNTFGIRISVAILLFGWNNECKFWWSPQFRVEEEKNKFLERRAAQLEACGVFRIHWETAWVESAGGFLIAKRTKEQKKKKKETDDPSGFSSIGRSGRCSNFSREGRIKSFSFHFMLACVFAFAECRAECDIVW